MINTEKKSKRRSKVQVNLFLNADVLLAYKQIAVELETTPEAVMVFILRTYLKQKGLIK